MARAGSLRMFALVALASTGVVAGSAAASPPPGTGAPDGPPAARADAPPARLCPPGYVAADVFALLEEYEFGEGTDDREAAPAPNACVSAKHPEPFGETVRAGAEQAARAHAPLATVPAGAFRAAMAQRNAATAAAAQVPGTAGTWTPLGRTPLISNDPEYPAVNGLGLAELNGRVDSLAHDPETGRLFAIIGTGGVWMSEDTGTTWRSVGDSLPTQIVGAVAWSPAGGGTLVVVSGEHLQGGNTYTGLGAYWSNNLGRTWQRANGVPDGAMGFQVAVDPSQPSVVYVGTSKGLYRSADTGRSFVNVALPTEECAGKIDDQRCVFANFVTDVVVRAPGGVGAAGGGMVLAAVGYRAGPKPFPDGKPQSPANGLYRSETGEPGTFEKLPAPGFAPQERIGRVELGAAYGAEQDHDYVYAIVQDAVLFNGGVPVIDVPDGQDTAIGIPNNTSLNGIYVSSDFGETWTMMADDVEISQNPATGSALAGVGTALLFAPGVQAWYNAWIQPDPTRQTAEGVPTRLLFGLEEVWQNRATTAPQNTAVQDPRGDFKVIGRYFADETCFLLDLDFPACPTSEPPVVELTTHPDQHDAIFLPDGNGGVTLVIGNDGGVYVQHAAGGEEFSNTDWGEGNNDGFHTLLPYAAEVAKDGTVWYGLQDNGSGKITPDGRQLMTFGGDGFFVAVDPDNADYAWSETPFAGMRVTTDGGRTWKESPPPISNSKFSNPFVMDPTDAQHLLTAGAQVVETVEGADTCTTIPNAVFEIAVECSWTQVFDLGTAENPGRAPDDTYGTPAATDRSARNSMSALDLHGDAAYVGYCGPCDLLNNWHRPFQSGIATNVGGDAPPQRMTSDGWHIAAASGLPDRYVNAIAMDPADPRTVYVALSGYANRQWVPPGSYLDPNRLIGTGTVFKSTDAGATFTDISGNLPDAPAFSIEVHGNQLVVGTQVGVFLSRDSAGGVWAPLDGLPAVPISTIRNHPGDPDVVVVATYGRGVYSYRFPAGTGGAGAGAETQQGAQLPATGGGGAVLLLVTAAAALALAAGLTAALRRPRRT